MTKETMPPTDVSITIAMTNTGRVHNNVCNNNIDDNHNYSDNIK